MLTKNISLMRAEIIAHIEADAVVGGQYWVPADNAVGGTGCFIACLSHSNDANALGARFGLPLMLVRICECVFENLPEDDRPVFFAEIGEAVGTDGRDLTQVVWAFLADTLRHLPPQTGDVKDAIDRVIAGMDLLASGNGWDAARAATYAARAATRAATYAARAATRAATYAAEAARAATRAATYAAEAATCAARAADAAAYAAEDATYAEVQRQRTAIINLIANA